VNITQDHVIENSTLKWRDSVGGKLVGYQMFLG